MKDGKNYPLDTENCDMPKMEEAILKYWQENKIFEQSVEKNPAKIDSKNNEFIFYDGPPFANGLPHYGHLLTGYVKDLVARYKTMKGLKSERRFGWDCHGLPAEMGAEKELKISGRNEIIKYGVDKFNEHCRKSVLKFTNEWEKYVNRQARWVDFKNDYKTMDINYMESVIWAFKQLYDKGLAYESMRVMPYSWACETPLSNFETRLDNSYRERADKSVTVKFKLTEKIKNFENAYLLAWTTTPWTLPSNLAVAVGSNIKYVGVEKSGEILIIAESSLAQYKNEIGENVVLEITGDELAGLKYEPVFPYFKDNPNSFRVLPAEFVVEGDGTAIVHIAPGFGEDDQLLSQKHGIDLVCPVDNSGKFTQEVPDFAGKLVFDANDEIIIKLKQENKWVKTEQYLHNYPHCWRTDTPLIYKAVPSWYIEVTKFKDRMVELNQQINWIPGHIKNGLFGKWLENAKDWSISRNRFWGTPIPVWKSDDPKYPRIDVYGSIAEMEKDFGVKISDLHKHHIDELTRPNPDDPTGKSMMRRVEDVFDCWFESGSMPFAQVHYPFENTKWFEEHGSADFIVEYVAQTRGWFYTLMVLSTALFDRPPFLNCICHGVILDEKGQKLSKRLNNYADPLDIFSKYGSDPLRWLMMKSAVMRGQELLIDKEGKLITEIVRSSIKPIWSAYHFFCLYANADKITAKEIKSSANNLDSYILAKLRECIRKVEMAMDSLLISDACFEIENFMEVLNNWYIRRSRSRFWDEKYSEDKQLAYDSLYTILINLAKISAPLLPYISEEIYLGLTNSGQKSDSKSVHLENYPDYKIFEENQDLINKMDRIRSICNIALSIRNSENIRIRQPLNKLTYISDKEENLEDFFEIVKDELNIKHVVTELNVTKYAEFKLKLNFPILGKRLPEKMKDFIQASKQGNWKYKNSVLTLAGEEIYAEEYELKLEPKIEKAVALPSQDSIVILDLEITDELKNEGIVRDLVRFIQQTRKDAKFNITDRVIITIQAEQKFCEIIKSFAEYIQAQTLSSLEFADEIKGSKIEGNIEDYKFNLGIQKQ